MMKGKIDIKNLESNLGNFSLVAKVVEKSQPILIDGKKTAYAIIADETGSVKLNLHGNQIEQVILGKTARIKGAFTEINNDTLEVFTWKDIELIDDILG